MDLMGLKDKTCVAKYAVQMPARTRSPLVLMPIVRGRPTNLAGSSILPLAQKRPTPFDRKDYIVSEYHSFYSPTGIFMVRHGDYKLILFGARTLFCPSESAVS